MAYVSTSSELFKLMKRAVYEYIEQRENEAREANRDFTRPIVGDPAIQQLVDVVQKRRGGDETVAVRPVMGKVSFPAAAFLNQFLEQLDVKEFIRTAITLPAADRQEFVKDVEKLVTVSPARRQALLDVIRSVLPKAEGLKMKSALIDGIKKGDLSAFIDFTDVAQEGEEG